MKLKLIILSLLFVLIISCSSSFVNTESQNVSSTKQITAKTFRCEVNNQRAQEILNKYSQYFRGSSSLKESAAKALSNVPSEYFGYVFDKYKTPVNLYYNYGGGVTYLIPTYQQGTLVYYPESIETEILALPHEFGHASMGYTQLTKNNFNNALRKISILTLNKYNYLTSWYLQTYASVDQDRDDELYAELFDTWYCSKASREELKRTMPEVYDFALNYLISPLDESLGNSGSVDSLNNNSSQAITKYPVALAQSPWDKDSYYLLFKVNESISEGFSLMYCISDKQTCMNDISLHQMAKVVDTSRKIFISSTSINLYSNPDANLWILIKTSNQYILKRGIKISSN